MKKAHPHSIVREIREWKGLSQAELARRLKVHRNTIVRLETHDLKVSRYVAEQLSKLSGVSVADIRANICLANRQRARILKEGERTRQRLDKLCARIPIELMGRIPRTPYL